MVNSTKLQVWVHPRPWLNAILLPLDAPSAYEPYPTIYLCLFESTLLAAFIYGQFSAAWRHYASPSTQHTQTHYIEKSLKAPVLTR
jgi:hypothetical protein